MHGVDRVETYLFYGHDRRHVLPERTYDIQTRDVISRLALLDGVILWTFITLQKYFMTYIILLFLTMGGDPGGMRGICPLQYLGRGTTYRLSLLPIIWPKLIKF